MTGMNEWVEESDYFGFLKKIRIMKHLFIYKH